MAKFKQVGKAILGAMIAASMAVGCFAGTALANEVQPRTTIDQAYVFAFGWYGHQGYSGTALKEDTTPTYVRAAVMDMPHVYLSVEGFDEDSLFWYNRTCGTYATLTQAAWQASEDKKFWIHTNVYEYNGYVDCVARFGGLASQAGNMSGEWSPDSWGTYPALNTPSA